MLTLPAAPLQVRRTFAFEVSGGCGLAGGVSEDGNSNGFHPASLPSGNRVTVTYRFPAGALSATWILKGPVGPSTTSMAAACQPAVSTPRSDASCFAFAIACLRSSDWWIDPDGSK